MMHGAYSVKKFLSVVKNKNINYAVHYIVVFRPKWVFFRYLYKACKSILHNYINKIIYWILSMAIKTQTTMLKYYI